MFVRDMTVHVILAVTSATRLPEVLTGCALRLDNFTVINERKEHERWLVELGPPIQAVLDLLDVLPTTDVEIL